MPGDDPPVETAETTTDEVVDTAVEEKKTEEAAKQLGSDELEERIATRVYDKIKAFVTELTTASDDINQLVSESVAAKTQEMAPAEEVAEEDAEDVKPRRSHKLFSRPGRKD